MPLPRLTWNPQSLLSTIGFNGFQVSNFHYIFNILLSANHLQISSTFSISHSSPHQGSLLNALTSTLHLGTFFHTIKDLPSHASCCPSKPTYDYSPSLAEPSCNFSLHIIKYCKVFLHMRNRRSSIQPDRNAQMDSGVQWAHYGYSRLDILKLRYLICSGHLTKSHVLTIPLEFRKVLHVFSTISS